MRIFSGAFWNTAFLYLKENQGYVKLFRNIQRHFSLIFYEPCAVIIKTHNDIAGKTKEMSKICL